MNGDVQNFNGLMGDLFPGYTDIVAEMSDRSITVGILKKIAKSGLSLFSVIPAGKSVKRVDDLVMEGSTMTLVDSKSRAAYRVGLPLRIMVARFPSRPIHNFIRINYEGVPGPEDREKKVSSCTEYQEAADSKVRVMESPGWFVIYPLGSLLSDQRLDNRVRDLVINGRESTMFKEFMAIDEKTNTHAQMIALTDYTPVDAALWEKWTGNMDTNMFQTNVRPQNFSAAKGQSDEYYLKLIQHGSRKIGAVWVEKISQRTATAELGLLIGEPHLWGMGIGSRAISEMMKIAKKDLGLNFLWVSVRESNQRAVNCYQRGGFKIVRKVPVYKTDGSYQMWVHMEKMI
ncbi:MAG: GNAT family N-acetyltransferase [Actinobacteria bacterium]|nr:GNAT family N-acetyltransferase [Actinomycetota bacterium]